MSEDKITQHRRNQLHKLMRTLSFEPLMRGTIVERARRCGRKNCACSKDTSKQHPSLVLSVHLNGKTHALYLRPQDVSQVQKAIDAYGKLWAIINGLTECEFGDLKRKVRERRRSRKRRTT